MKIQGVEKQIIRLKTKMAAMQSEGPKEGEGASGTGTARSTLKRLKRAQRRRKVILSKNQLILSKSKKEKKAQ